MTLFDLSSKSNNLVLFSYFISFNLIESNFINVPVYIDESLKSLYYSLHYKFFIKKLIKNV